MHSLSAANPAAFLPLFLADAGALAGRFTPVDWMVVAGYLLLTTVIGGILAGKQKDVKDFFLGGRNLPWHAVAASSIATEISAVTFVSVPFIVFQPGGNFAYLQWVVVGGLFSVSSWPRF